ncbi:MAG: metal-dependent transcriptional regulator [Desulfobacterales bacterium]|nr:metal-dependent transcriptional regulator [Desulfobacterales bacterium]
MKNGVKEKEEYLECLWGMKEQKSLLIDSLKKNINQTFDEKILDSLVADGFANILDKEKKVVLTEKGESRAREIIRAHRIGERLLYDVFGEDFEEGACEFEHIKSIELVDSICTLLGHPRECPHGKPIPEGECCKRSAKTAHNMIAPLTDLEIGQSAKIAYIECKDDSRMHKLNGLQIRPGTFVKLHQCYPCYVLECEGANIALDEDIVSNIRIWLHSSEKNNNKKDV